VADGRPGPPRREGYLRHRPSEGHDHQRGENVFCGGRAGPAPRPEVADVVVLASPTPPGARPSSPWSSWTRRPTAPRVDHRGHPRRAGGSASPSVHIVDELPRSVRQGRDRAATGAAGYRRSVRRNSMSVEPVRILAFVNHIAPVPGSRPTSRGRSSGASTSSWRRAPAATGARTGSAREQVSANQAANVEPYVRAAIEHVCRSSSRSGSPGPTRISTPAWRRSTRSAPQRWSLTSASSGRGRPRPAAGHHRGWPAGSPRARARPLSASPPATSTRLSGSWP
jgi:hypothetical protein